MSFREVILDTETTGIAQDEQGPQRIISLGLVEMVNHKKTGREREWFFNPERGCTRDAYAVHGIRDSWLEKQSLFRYNTNEIIEFLGDDTIIAHNPQFDRRFVNLEFALATGMRNPTSAELNRFPPEQWIDSLKVARKRFPKQPNGLDDLADRFGVYRGHRIKHGALKDARILADVWEHLSRGDQGSLFDQLDEGQSAGGIVIEAPEIDYAARKAPRPRLTSAEKTRHDALIADWLGDAAVWHDYTKKGKGK